MNCIQNNSRISWIDIVKGIGICLVVLGHVYRFNSVLIWIYSFHMPLFFALSGGLRGCDRKIVDWIAFVKKKFISLIVPVIVFLPILFIYWLIVERHFREFDIGPIWFLPALFFAEVVAEIIFNCSNKKVVRGIIPLVALLLYFCSLMIDSRTLLVWIPRCLGGFLFYLMGAAAADLVTVKTAIERVSRPTLLGIVVVFAALSIVLSQLNGRVDLYSLIFGNFLLYLIAAIVGTLFVIQISILIRRCKPLEFLGRYSLIILCTHEQVKRAFIQVCSIVTKSSAEEIRNHILFGIGISVFVILIEVVVVYVVVKIGQIFKNTKLKWLFSFIK